MHEQDAGLGVSGCRASFARRDSSVMSSSNCARVAVCACSADSCASRLSENASSARGPCPTHGECPGNTDTCSHGTELSARSTPDRRVDGGSVDKYPHAVGGGTTSEGRAGEHARFTGVLAPAIRAWPRGFPGLGGRAPHLAFAIRCGSWPRQFAHARVVCRGPQRGLGNAGDRRGRVAIGSGACRLETIAGLIAALAFVLLVGFLAVPLFKLGRVFDETRHDQGRLRRDRPAAQRGHHDGHHHQRPARPRRHDHPQRRRPSRRTCPR